ncbi:MAG TPA: hypothetical protein PKA49_12350 [Tepidiformaceae bacterium]|nr:hypothetical protein [Tepidiformaceae bacterium]
MTRWRALSAVYVAAIVIGISALLWVQAGYAEPGYDKLALPLTYAIATLAVVVGLRWRVNEATLATLPALGTMTAATAWWAAAGIPDAWKPAWLALGANGYLVVAHVRARGQEQAWAAVAACGAAVALFMAHALVVPEGADHAALPAAHALVLAGVSAAYLRWRWVEAAALLPAAVAGTAGTAWWAAWGLADEWRPMVAIVAGAGYLVLAHLEGRGREQAWAATALAVATLGIVLEHALVTVDGASHWPLAAAYAAAGAGLASVYARWRWFKAGALLPPVVAMAAWAAWWADRGMPDEWRPLVAVVAAAGYLLLAHLEGRGRERTWAALALGAAGLSIAVTHPLVLVEDASRWPLAIGYGAAAAGVATVYARWRWFEAGALLPPVVAMAAWAAWWADRGMPDEWRPLCAIAAAAGYLLLAHLEGRGRERTWAALGLAFAVTAIAFEHVLTPVEGADRAPLPLAYAALFVGLSSAYGRWRWVEAATLMPPAGAMAIASPVWARDAVAIEWYATVVAGAALGYLALAFIDGPMRRSGWQFAAAVTGALAVGMSAVTPAFEDPNRWAMPVPADFLLAGALAAFARFRWRWRVAPAAIPALAAFAAASASWANWNLAVEWYAPFASAAAAGYLLLGHFEDRPFQGRWARAAILISLAAIVVPQFAVTLPESTDRWSLVCVYGGAAAVALAAALRWRWRLPEAFAVAPPALAATGAAALWAAVDMPLDWLGAWAAAAAVGYAAIAPWAPGRTGIRWRLAGAATGGLALVVAHAFVNSHNLEEVSRLRFQLPITYAILLVGATWDGARWRDGGLFVAPVLGATTGFATLWAAGVDAAWAPFPALAIAALLIATAPWWLRQRGPDVGGWAYTVAFAALPTLLFLPHNLSHAPQGLASQVISAALLAVAAFRTKGGVSQFFARTSPIYPEGERSVLIQAAAAFAFGAAASANQLAGIEGPGQAWAFAIVGCAAWAGAGLLGARAGWSWTFTPLGLAGSLIAAVVAGDAYGVLASVLALSVVAQVAAAAGSRRWSLLGTASAFAWLAVWAAWQWRDLENAYLSLVYAGFAAVEWAAFFTIRRHARLTTESGAVVFFLSWSSWTTAAVASGFVLGQRGRDLDPNTSIETTTEWTLAAAVLAMASAAVMAEGFRLARRPVWMTASAGLLVALLMAIATREPSNVQAYTAPIGVYLIVMAFTYRHTAPIIDPHLQLHEAVMVVGALFLVLPPASQSFDPDGGVYGLELIGIGIAMLLGGLALHGRWLVASALVTITATAGRLVTGGYFAVPYWALLGVAGTALIAAGLLILSLRAAWDRFRLAVVEWWNTAAPRGPLLPPSA